MEYEMKITASQLRRIIREEASQLNEIFTSVGGIGFGDLPRRPRPDFHNLTTDPGSTSVTESDMDECGEMPQADPVQVVVNQVMQSGADVSKVIQQLVMHLGSR
jgi:hypothetical protein